MSKYNTGILRELGEEISELARHDKEIFEKEDSSKLENAVKHFTDVTMEVVGNHVEKEFKSILQDHCKKLLDYTKKIVNASDLNLKDSKEQLYEVINIVEYCKVILVLSERVLQQVEATEIKNIVDRAEELLEATDTVKECKSVGKLLIAFKKFVKILLKFCYLVENRRQASPDPSEHSIISSSLGKVKSCIPELSQSSQRTINHPEDTRSAVQQSIIIDTINHSINLILQTLDIPFSYCDIASLSHLRNPIIPYKRISTKPLRSTNERVSSTRKKSPTRVHFQKQKLGPQDEAESATLFVGRNKPPLVLYQAIKECKLNLNRLVNQISENQKIGNTIGQLQDVIANVGCLLTEVKSCLNQSVKRNGKSLSAGSGSHSIPRDIPAVSSEGGKPNQSLTVSRCFEDQLIPLIDAAGQYGYASMEKQINIMINKIQLLGEMICRLQEASPDDSRIRNAKYAHDLAVKTTGQLCAQARKAIFCSENSAEVVHFYDIGKEWIDQRQKLSAKLMKAVTPWSSVIGSLAGFPDSNSSNQIDKVLQLTRRFTSLIETCIKQDPRGQDMVTLFTERQSELKLKLSECGKELNSLTSNLISLVKVALVKKTPLQEQDTFEIWCFGWACTCHYIMHLLGQLTNQVPLNLGMNEQSITTNELKIRNSTWKNILEDLSLSCCDLVIIEDISSAVKDLELLENGIMKMIEYGHVQDQCGHVQDQCDHVQDQCGHVQVQCSVADLIILEMELRLKMHLILKIADEVTGEVTEPLKSLLEPYQQPLITQSDLQFTYADRKKAFLLKMDRIKTLACLAVEPSSSRNEIHIAIMALNHLEDVTNDVIVLADGIPDDRKIVTGDSPLKLETVAWKTKALCLIQLLRRVPEANFTAVAAVMRHFQTGCDVSLPNEFAEVLQDPGSPVKRSPHYRNFDCYSSPTNDDELERDFDSSLSSGLGYPLSRDSAIYSDMRSLPSHNQYLQDEHFFATHPRDDDRKDLSLRHSSPHPNQIHKPYYGYEENNFLKTTSHHHKRGPRSKCLQEDSEVKAINCDVKAGLYGPESTQLGSVVDSMETLSVNENSKNNVMLTDLSEVSSVLSNGSVDTVIRRSFVVRDQETSKTSQSIAAVAHILQREVDQWDTESNSIVQVVQQMTKQMFQMAEFARGRGRLKSKEDFINTAKAIAANANMVTRFACIIADHCRDKVCQDNLLHYSELVPTISTQLRIVASVKAATPADETADTMLTANAENLMKAVIGTLKAAEAASVMGPRDITLLEKSESSDDLKNIVLKFNWKRKMDLQRTIETLAAPTNDLGLRVLSGMKLQSSSADFTTIRKA